MTTYSSASAGGPLAQVDTRADELNVLVDGDRWTGWRELEVVRTLDAASGRFTLKIPPTLGTTWPLLPGKEIEIGLGEEQILTGSVDAVSAELAASGRLTSVSGRDRSGVLVDCTVKLSSYEWRDQTLLQIVKDVAGPFGIKVGEATGAARERFPLFGCSATDKAWGVIERACRQKGLLAYSMPNGKLRLARPPGVSSEVDLIEGGNIIKARFRWDVANRFRTYRVEGQRPGSDEGWGDEVISLAGEARDLEIAFDRLLTIRGEQGMTTEDCLVRAQWEATVRRARSTALDIEVAGWRQGIEQEAGLPPWDVNLTTYVTLPSLGIEGTWLISRVRFSRGLKGGARTKLELVPPDSYAPAPELSKPASINGFLISEEGAQQ